MATEHVEITRAAYAAFREGDVEAALTHLDPEIVVYDHERNLDSAKEYRGPAGLVQMAANAAETFDEHRYEPEDFRAVGDRVLVRVRRTGRGRQSGIYIDEPQWHLWTFRGDRAVEMRAFVDERQARAAVGA